MVGIEEALEILRGVPVPCWLFLPAVFLSFGLGPVPVAALHEFTAHRMQHFDLHGVRYGKLVESCYHVCMYQYTHLCTSWLTDFLNGAHLFRFSQCPCEYGG